MYKAVFGEQVNTEPSFIELIETAVVVEGMRAILVGAENPGPEIKKPKTSLKTEQLNSGYSSEPNTYSNSINEPTGCISNSKTQASNVFAITIAFN